MRSDLVAVLVTFQRPDDVLAMLDAIAAQTVLPSQLHVIDNGSQPTVADIAANHRLVQTISVDYVNAGDNLGPAGGIALGMHHALERDACEWVLLLDDDDPPPEPNSIEELLELATVADHTVANLGGVGLAGARLNRTRGTMHRLRDHELHGIVEVDYLGGNNLPMFRRRAIEAVGTFEPKLFFGWEELEYGLRLQAHGYSIVADGDEWLRRRWRLQAAASTDGIDLSPVRHPWRRYYTARNLIRILLTHQHRSAAAVTTAREVAAALVGVMSKRESTASAKARMQGCIDGWRGISGRSFEPGSRCAT